MSIAETQAQTAYQRLNDHLKEFGEIMVRTTSGDEIELHNHNVEFQEEPYLEIEADDEIHWLDATTIERYWIHKEL